MELVANCDKFNMPRKAQQKALEKPKISESVEQIIYVLRKQRVMLDADLAELYGVTTSRLNEQVKRNRHRFPEDFIFQLTKHEFDNLSQIATGFKHRDPKKLPFAFTEHGAVMLASVLNSPTAIEASIKVVRAFVQMRSVLALHQDLADRIEELEKVTDKHDQKFGVVSRLLSEILRDPKFLKRKIGLSKRKKKKQNKVLREYGNISSVRNNSDFSGWS